MPPSTSLVWEMDIAAKKLMKVAEQAQSEGLPMLATRIAGMSQSIEKLVDRAVEETLTEETLDELAD